MPATSTVMMTVTCGATTATAAATGSFFVPFPEIESSEADLDDDGEESDLEDNETPWKCVLRIRRLSPANDEGWNRARKGVKLVATMSPTSHHPKVAGY
jgi:hypothetical protein